MAEKEFLYDVAVEWKGEKTGEARAQGLPPITFGAPVEFKGRGGEWTPEHLFVASVNTCFMLTFLASAAFSKLPLVSYASAARGKLEKVEKGGFQITTITITPTVVIGNAQDLAKARRLLEKAKENCFVTNSIRTTVHVEPEIYHHVVQVYPRALGERGSSS